MPSSKIQIVCPCGKIKVVLACYAGRAKYCSVACKIKYRTDYHRPSGLKYKIVNKNKGWFNHENNWIRGLTKEKDVRVSKLALNVSKTMKGQSMVEKGHTEDCPCSFCRDKTRENSHNWKGGIPSLSGSIRCLPEMVEWKKSVFKRDNYTCQKCNITNIRLNAHHKKPFIEVFYEFLRVYSNFSPTEDKEIMIRISYSYAPFWDISNGLTLCEKCHRKVHKEMREYYKGEKI